MALFPTTGGTLGGTQIQLTGSDWAKFERFIKYKWGHELTLEINKATGRAAWKIAKEITKRIEDKKYAANTLYTARKKGYSSAGEATPLKDTGKMIAEAIIAQDMKKAAPAGMLDVAWEVGIIGGRKPEGSNKTYEEFVEFIHEGVSFNVRLKNGRIIRARIPPRPFLREVFEDPKIHKMVRKEWTDGVRKIFRKHGKL